MEEKITELLNPKLEKLNLIVNSVKLEKEGQELYLRICLDSKEIINIEKIVEATKVINPIIDEADLIEEKYILDVYGKSKGSVEE